MCNSKSSRPAQIDGTRPGTRTKRSQVVEVRPRTQSSLVTERKHVYSKLSSVGIYRLELNDATNVC